MYVRRSLRVRSGLLVLVLLYQSWLTWRSSSKVKEKRNSLSKFVLLLVFVDWTFPHLKPLLQRKPACDLLFQVVAKKSVAMIKKLKKPICSLVESLLFKV